MKRTTWLFVTLLAVMVLPHTFMQTRTKTYLKNWWIYRQQKKVILVNLESAIAEQAVLDNQDNDQSGCAKITGVPQLFPEEVIRLVLKKNGNRPISHFYVWGWGKVPEAAASALGLDHEHHFVNSYLIGFQPFETDLIWAPLYTLSIRKRYEYDHIQYKGLADVWQNSRQAFYYTRGDCEDHSIILADWLISMGHDARVVLGKHMGEGHAWVVLFRDGKAYLLEATKKYGIDGRRNYPLAHMMTQYHPKYQFNRDTFWVNTKSTFTTRYSGSHWQARSRFGPCF